MGTLSAFMMPMTTFVGWPPAASAPLRLAARRSTLDTQALRRRGSVEDAFGRAVFLGDGDAAHPSSSHHALSKPSAGIVAGVVAAIGASSVRCAKRSKPPRQRLHGLQRSLGMSKPEPEIDPRRQDSPAQVPPVRMPVVDTGEGGNLDVMSKLLQDRVIILGGEVNDEMGQVLIAQMLYLASESPEEDITMYINSPGGSVSAGMAIFDTMQFIPCDVSTVCFGLGASMGSFLLAAGAKGKRKSLPNSRIMIHQPLGGAQGQATDIRIQAQEILFMREILNQHLADFTGQTQAKVEQDCDRDNFMTPEEAKDYGLIDEIIVTKSWPRIQKPPRRSV